MVPFLLALDRRPGRARPLAVALAALWPLAAPLTLLGEETPARASSGRPNIVLILADDLGFECLGSNGGTSYQTPCLDQLAREGMRFEHCYAQPLCTPSRVELMTGLYNQRNYRRFGLLDPGAVTFAHVLKGAGYRTAIAGKWQLAGGADGPRHFGFDEHLLWHLTTRGSRYPNPVLERDGKVIAYHGGEYGPDLITDFVTDFIRRHREEAFFVYHSMLLTHAPFEPTPGSADWDPKASGPPPGPGGPRHFAGMVRYADKMVGKVIRVLDELGLRQKTLVLFTADNGTAAGITSAWRGREVRGGKGSMTDAGTRVPLIASWPGVIPAGTVSLDLIDFSDFMPTLAEAAGAKLPPGFALDGQSFLPSLCGAAGRPRQWIYSWFARDGGLQGEEFGRTARFKLYGDGRFYDLDSDPLEERDLGQGPLTVEAAAARPLLSGVLARFRATRDPAAAAAAGKLAASAATISKLEALGGRVFSVEDRVVEVILHGREVTDETLRLVAEFPDLTDLSLEHTRVGDEGMAQLRKLEKLEWLNLYGAEVGDRGLEELSHIRSLKLLPIGATRVTDAGLKHLEEMPQLEYLGLRRNRVSDAGLKHLERLTALKGLHLGESAITAAGLKHLRPLRRLEQLWLDDTAITDECVPHLKVLESLHELHVANTKLSPAGLKALRQALPDCRILTEK